MAFARWTPAHLLQAEQQHQARLQASPDPPMPVQSSNKVLKIKDMYNNAGSEFVLSKVEGSMAEVLGDITQMVFGLDAASQTRKVNTATACFTPADGPRRRSREEAKDGHTSLTSNLLPGREVP